MQEVYNDILDAGASLIAISPQLSKYSKQVVSKNKLSFPVLSDEGNKVAEQFGTVVQLPEALKEIYLSIGIDLERFNGNDSWTLPIAGHFIIDANGIVQHVAIDIDHSNRPEPTDLLGLLANI